MNIDDTGRYALKQIDTLGYYLSRYGISDQVNRHNLIALALTEKNRIMAEASRMELKARIQKHKVELLAQKLDKKADHYIAMTPKPLAKRLSRAKALLA